MALLESVDPKLKNTRVDIIALIIVTGFIVSIIFHYIYGYIHPGYPYNTFLFKQSDRFNDFFNVYKVVLNLKPYSTYNLPYFPFAILLIYAFTVIPKKISLIVMLGIFLAILFYQNRRFLVDSERNIFYRYQKLLICTLISYPVLFAIDRGNVEVLLYVFLALFFFYYYIKNSPWAVLFLACAIAMKLYPAVLLVLLFSDRKYFDFILTIIYTGVIFFLGYLLMHEGTLSQTINLHLKALGSFNDLFLVSNAGLQHNHTLYGLMRGLDIAFGNSSHLNLLKSFYPKLVIGLFGVISLFVTFFEKTHWKKVTLLIIPMIFFPNVSFDYTLIHLFFPIVIFINSELNGKLDSYYCVLFGLMLIPFSYHYFSEDVSISAGIYPAIMLLLMTSIIVQTIYSKWRTKATNGSRKEVLKTG